MQSHDDALTAGPRAALALVLLFAVLAAGIVFGLESLPAFGSHAATTPPASSSLSGTDAIPGRAAVGGIADQRADAVAALVADGAGSAEDVTAAAVAACTDPHAAAALAATGWTPGQLVRLADAAPCATGPALGTP